MRILVISNFYPPHYFGGYELGCRDVVEGLRKHGHEVAVLSSTYGVSSPRMEGQVYRWLTSNLSIKADASLPLYIINVARKEYTNRSAFTRLCNRFSPELIYVWNPEEISLTLPIIAQKKGIPVAFYVFDDWMAKYERIDSWRRCWKSAPAKEWKVPLKAFLKKLMKRMDSTLKIELDLTKTQFASHYLKEITLQNGKPVVSAKVIYFGINLDQFCYKQLPHNPRRLLYVGQLAPEKGVHTAIEAMNLLVNECGYSSTKLTIAGGSAGILSDYMLNLKEMISSWGLEDHVHFTGLIPREKLPNIYQEHDILLFPSIWDEPFGITILEAMSCGLAVIGTGTGGSSEILQHEVNSLTFSKGDAGACVRQIIRLLNDEELFENIRRNGRQTVEDKFRFEHTLDSIETWLSETIA